MLIIIAMRVYKPRKGNCFLEKYDHAHWLKVAGLNTANQLKYVIMWLLKALHWVLVEDDWRAGAEVRAEAER